MTKNPPGAVSPSAQNPRVPIRQPLRGEKQNEYESSKLLIRILTHNIRYATTSPFPGEAPWPLRAPHLISELRFHTLHSPSFICLQEVLHAQLTDILTGLRRPSSGADEPEPPSEWRSIGVGRDDGATAGEYSPILYRPRDWTLEHQTTKWLSPTPDTPSRGWDAASTRIVTVGVFARRGSPARVLTLNTHLDDQGWRSRREGARLIADTIEEYVGAGGQAQGAHVFLAGDFNSVVGGEAYRVLNGEGSPVRDVRDLVPEERWYGHCDTFTGFDDGAEEPMKRIDFVFLGKVERWRPVMYGVLENRFRGIYNSDHRAVVADAVLGESEC